MHRPALAEPGSPQYIDQAPSTIAGSLFSGYAASGSFNRSGVSYAAGAKTPLAAALFAVRLLAIVLRAKQATRRRHQGDAIQAIYPRLDSEICRTCTARIFRECHVALPDGTPRTAAG